MENNENMNKKCELTDEELSAVAGGSGDEVWKHGDWCSYESVKNHFHFSHDFADSPKTEFACRVMYAMSTPHGYVLDIEGFMHYFWSMNMGYSGRWYTVRMGDATVDAEYAVKINAPEWADECNHF